MTSLKGEETMSSNCNKCCLTLFSGVKHFIKTVSVSFSHGVELRVKMKEQSCVPKKKKVNILQTYMI